jgi:hypothetical protein
MYRVDYEELQPRLDAVIVRYEEDAKMAAQLEARIGDVIQSYATQVRPLVLPPDIRC